MRVLIAEDKVVTRLDLRAILEDAGFEVCGEAADGLEAVELALELRPDLAVVDVGLPLLDGIEAVRRIRAELPIPIVMVTGERGAELLARAVDAGVFGYVVKPFREADLLPAITTALARHDELMRARAAAPAAGQRQAGMPAGEGERLDILLPASEGEGWPVSIERRPDGTLDVKLAS